MDRINRLKQFLEKEPNDQFLNHALGLEFIKAGDIQNGIDRFKKILDNDPNYIPSYYHLADALIQLNLREEAKNTYLKGMEVCKHASDMHAYNELKGAFDNLEF